MKDSGRIVVLVGLGVGALYLLMRSREQALAAAHHMLPDGRAFINPTAPSPLGLNVGGGTNPLTAIFSGITSVLTRLTSKQPGNLSSSPSTSSTTTVPTLGWTLTRGSNYIPPPPLNPTFGTPGVRLPNLGDPTFAGWDNLGGVPDLSWTLSPDANVIPPPPETGGGLPDLTYTLDPGSLGFDPYYIPPPPGSGA